MSAVGMIEAIGLTAACAALDAACKAAEVTLIGVEKVIGAGKAVTVTIHLTGEVAAVQAGVDAGVAAAEKTGSVLAHRVMARPHDEVLEMIATFQRKKPHQDSRRQAMEAVMLQQPKSGRSGKNTNPENKEE